MSITGVNQLILESRRAVKELEDDAIEKVKEIVRAVVTELMARTPVWTGHTIRNYSVYAFGAAGGLSGEIDEIGSGPTGATGHMPLGVEPRRAANEAAVWTETESMLSGYRKLGRSIAVSNFSPTWELVEAGSAPTPERARNPGGVSELAVQSVRDEFQDVLR